jgi:hypothetical protein
MRGEDRQTAGLFSYVSCEARVPVDHPLRAIWAIVGEALAVLSPQFEKLYANAGRPSIPFSRSMRCVGELYSGVVVVRKNGVDTAN